MKSLDLNVHDVTNLIAVKVIESGSPLSVLKLQKLLYYVEAWHVTFFNKMLFKENFEAWVHGPVCRPVFTRFRRDNKFMFSQISLDDLNLGDGVSYGSKKEQERLTTHISNVLQAYGHLSGPQLEGLSHREDPWLQARGDLSPNQPCSDIISKESMKLYYSKLQ